eukprot:9553587-Alexandrium_andersonii.AAC.4
MDDWIGNQVEVAVAGALAAGLAALPELHPLLPLLTEVGYRPPDPPKSVAGARRSHFLEGPGVSPRRGGGA